MKKAALVLLLLASLCTLALADSSAAYMYVYAYLIPSAKVAADYLYFGGFKLGDSSITASTTIYVQATADLPYNVTMDAGLHFDGIDRNVAYDSSTTRYRLFKPGGGEWGDNDYANTFQYGSSLAGTGDGAWQNYTVSGVLWPYYLEPGTPANVYLTDAVLVTVYW